MILNQKTLAKMLEEDPELIVLLTGRKLPKTLRSHDYRIVDGHLVKTPASK